MAKQSDFVDAGLHRDAPSRGAAITGFSVEAGGSF
jgi:hypothetical protein